VRDRLTHPTNATKANAIALANALIALVTAFGLDLSADQIAAILTVINIVASAWVGLTYKQSPTRISDVPGGRFCQGRSTPRSRSPPCTRV
jgi:hypothetical protein